MVQLIDEAAAQGVQRVHFQECCNYPTSYDNREEAWQHAVTIPGPMFDAIAERARQHAIHISFNAALRGPFPNAWMVNHLIGPGGEYIGGNKKQVLMWIERDAFVPSDEENLVFDTSLGRIGLLSCMDGLIPETARTLACQGADIILNALCSNGIDEAHLHIPARAAENGVYMISANRIGDMVKGADLDRLIAGTGMDREGVRGAGESQIVGPHGQVIARATRDLFGLTIADIDLDLVENSERLRYRRPELYSLLTEINAALADCQAGRAEARAVEIATLVPDPGNFRDMLRQCLSLLESCDAELVVMPELFAWQNAALEAGPSLAAEIALATAALAREVATSHIHIVAGLPEIFDGALVNTAVLIGPDGVLGSYRQAHVDPAMGWAAPGDGFPVFDLPFGRIGLLLGEDLFYPEAARVLARKGVDCIACPATWRSDWHHALMLTERSAENHVTIVAAGRADSPAPAPGSIVTTPTVYRFPETMEVNNPDRFAAPGVTGIFTARIDLSANRDKRLMASTDLIMDSQPALYGRLVAAKEIALS
jgi:predicted amidohydrolase